MLEKEKLKKYMEKIVEWVNCEFCNSVMPRMRKSKKFCSRSCWDKFQRVKQQENKEEILNEVLAWVIYIKEKKFWADTADIFRLIHFHSLIFTWKSHEKLIEGNEPEARLKVFNLMYKDLIDYVKTRKK